jgi:cytochrome c6
MRICRLLPITLLITAGLGCNSSQKLDSLTPGAGSVPAAAQQRRSIAAEEPSPADDGHQIFLANCTGCHGKNADGDTPAGHTWHVPNLHSVQVQSQADPQLLTIIRQGKGRMPAWGGLLSQIDIDHVLAYVRTLR